MIASCDVPINNIVTISYLSDVQSSKFIRGWPNSRLKERTDSKQHFVSGEAV